MEQIVEHLTELSIANGVISKEEQEIYRYGLEQLGVRSYLYRQRNLSDSSLDIVCRNNSDFGTYGP